VFRFRLRHPRLFIAAFAILAAAAVMIFLLRSGGDSRPDYPYPVQTFEDQGREHLPVGQRYDFYNSNPPTSGPHSAQPTDWGVHEEPVPKEMPVHNLEHCGVAILYDCSAGVPLDDAQCRELSDQLAALVKSNLSNRKPVLMAPYAGLEHRIALTAWRTLDTLDQFDEGRVQAFIDAYDRKFNPEGF
jgi:hypothetical protein